MSTSSLIDRRRGLARGGLRLRLAGIAALVTLIALVVSAVALVSMLRHRLDSAATAVALAKAQDVATLAADGALPAQLAFPGEDDALIQVVTVDGTVVASTGNIDGEPPIGSQRPTGPDDVMVTTSEELPIGDGHRFRVVAIATDSPDHGPVVVYAGGRPSRPTTPSCWTSCCRSSTGFRCVPGCAMRVSGPRS